MDPNKGVDLKRYLPHSVASTLAVVGGPLATVMWLEAHGFLRSPLWSFVLGAGLSWAASLAGAALWMRKPGSSDIVFSDLMIWGWLRRARVEKRVMQTAKLLSGAAHPTGTGAKRHEQIELLQRLAADLERKEPYTHGHSRRVARHAALTARMMGLDRKTVDLIRTAGAVHDVGKLHVPRDILNKPGRLSDKEFEAVKQHPSRGAEMVATIDNAELTRIVRHHHERLDGRGYPDGLSGAAIPMGARIIAVVDTFDAISSARPYRPAAQHKKAIEVLKKEAGSQLDSDAVEAFLHYYSGRRTLGWWVFLANAPQRLVGNLTRSFRGFGAQGIGNTVASAGTAALVGASVLVGGAALGNGSTQAATALPRNRRIILAEAFEHSGRTETPPAAADLGAGRSGGIAPGDSRPAESGGDTMSAPPSGDGDPSGPGATQDPTGGTGSSGSGSDGSASGGPEGGNGDPVAPDPVAPDPVAPDPVVPDPVAPDPLVPDPLVPDPLVPDPLVPDPLVPDPLVPDPLVPDPLVPDPVVPDGDGDGAGDGDEGGAGD